MPNYVKPFVSLIDGTLLNLPAADGATGQVMQTDGAGALSFVSVLKDVVDDTTPQLGGTLDANGNNIENVIDLEATRIGIGTDITADCDLIVAGKSHFQYTATEDQDHLMEITCDSAGFAGVKAVDLSYDCGALATGDIESCILISVDGTSATGGNVFGVQVLTTDGSNESTVAFCAGVEVDPLKQLSGIFGDLDSFDVDGVDNTTAVNTGGAGNVSFFVDDNDTIVVGNTEKFQQIEFILSTGASERCNPTYEYSTGVGTWQTFNPTDSTNQFKQTGNIQWLDEDTPSFATGADSEYQIRITRTRNTVNTVPVATTVQVSAATEYKWDKDGDISANTLTMSGSGDSSFAGNLGIGTTSPNGTLHVQTASTGATPNAAADDLVIENSGANTGITLLSGTGNFCNIYFGDSADVDRGRINYNHATDSMAFRTNAVDAVTIDSSQQVGIGTSSPGELLDVNGDARITNLGLNTLASSSYSLYSSNTAIGLGGALFEGSSNAVVIDDTNDYTGLGTAIFTTYDGLQLAQLGTSSGYAAIFDGGNVGIGDTAPGHLLEIADGFRTAPVSSPSGTAESGRIYMDSDDDRLKVYANGADRPLNTMSPILIRPQQLVADSTNGFGITTRNQHVLAAFDDTTDEIGYYTGVLPDDYQGDGLTVEINWVAATATTNATTWTAAFERIAQNGQDIDSDGFNTAQTQNSNCQSTNGRVTRSEIEFTNSQIDGLLVGETFRLKITRDTTDTMTGDAQIVGILIKGTNDA